MSYIFTKDNPPLMDQNPSILSVPASSLVGPITTSKSQPNSPQTNNDSQHDHWQTYNSFIINRWQYWAITSPSHHYNSTTNDVISVMNGYDETHMTQFVKSLSATVGAEGCGMSASVTAELSLTTQDTRSWQTSKTETTTVTYEAGKTYIGWTLYDHLEVASQLWYQYEYKGDSPPGFGKQGDPITSYFDVVISNYDDVKPDPTGAFVPSTRALFSHGAFAAH